MSHEIVESDEYGEEAVIRLANGLQLRTNAGIIGEKIYGGDYVRVVDGTDELAYWDHAEWQAEPQVVMGAILASLSGVLFRTTTRPETKGVVK